MENTNKVDCGSSDPDQEQVFNLNSDGVGGGYHQRAPQGGGDGQLGQQRSLQGGDVPPGTQRSLPGRLPHQVSPLAR